MWTGIISLLTFRRNALSPCSGPNSKPCMQQAQYFHPEDGNSSFLLHICILLSDYMASHPTRQCDCNINLTPHKTISNYNMYTCVFLYVYILHIYIYIYTYILFCNMHDLHILHYAQMKNVLYSTNITHIIYVVQLCD
jgi:hypothetical protein